MELLISGTGKVMSGVATSYLGGSARDLRSFGWVNFGIAGSGFNDYGKAYLGNRIASSAGDGIWYPPAVWPKSVDMKRRVVVTVDAPTQAYPQDGSLVDMDASGFYAVASRMSTSEFCQVLKVVSDDPEHSIESIDKPTVIRLCHDALDQATTWLDAFCELILEEATKNSDPEFYDKLVDRLHFSVTQQHQLRRLLQQLTALGFEGNVDVTAWIDGKACLKALKHELELLRGTWREEEGAYSYAVKEKPTIGVL